MEAFKILLTTDVGLLSLGVIAFFMHFRKLANEKPGKEGWD